MDSSGLLAAALELFRARHHPGVVAACADALLELAPDDAARGPLHLLAARSLLALRRDAEAQREIRECLRLDPQCAAAYRLLGELATRADQLASAKIFLREAVRLAPDDLEAHEWLALVETMARPTAAKGLIPATDAAVGRSSRAARPSSLPLPAGPVTPAPSRRRELPIAAGFGQYLVDCGLLSPVQLRAALVYQRSTGVRLGAAAVVLGFVSEPKIEWASLAYHGRHRSADREGIDQSVALR